MKTLVFGRESTVKKISNLMLNFGIQVICASSGIDTVYEAHKYDREMLAIVDSGANEAQATCNFINKSWRIPVFLAVEMDKVDWEQVNLARACGYIDINAGNAELAARLCAMVRPFNLTTLKNFRGKTIAHVMELAEGNAI